MLTLKQTFSVQHPFFGIVDYKSKRHRAGLKWYGMQILQVLLCIRTAKNDKYNKLLEK